MIDPRQVPKIKSTIELLENQLAIFENRIKECPEIKSPDNDQEKEKSRIMDVLKSTKEKISSLSEQIGNPDSETDSQPVDPLILLAKIQETDDALTGIKRDIKEISHDQYKCKLEVASQEINKTVDSILDHFDFIIPNIRNEISFLESYYRTPGHSSKSILPQLRVLIENLENNKIALRDFLSGYQSDTEKVAGYKELRSTNGIFSRYQFFENVPAAYKEVDACFGKMRKTMTPFLQERKSNPAFDHFLNEITDGNLKIARMNDIFQWGSFFKSMVHLAGKKFSYCPEIKQTKELLEEFEKIGKPLIHYNDEEVEKLEKTLESAFTQEDEKKKYSIIWKETKKYTEQKTLPFNRLETIISKLMKKDFNIVVQEKDADDITIKITPHLGSTYGEDLLQRINIIIQEIDFWYPINVKELLFQSLSQTTEKIQADEAVDKKEFNKLMQNYDKEIEKNIRNSYPLKTKLLNQIFSALDNVFSQKENRKKLERRLANKKIWDEIGPNFKNAKNSLLVLRSGNSSLDKHVNKFPFIKAASEELCQICYDLAMQLFVLFPGVGQKNITNMANILYTFNQFHDVGALWAAFSHYFKKVSVRDWNINEKLMIQFAQNPQAKIALKNLSANSP